MAAWTGFGVSSSPQGAVNNAHLSAQIDTLAVDYWPPHVSKIASAGASAAAAPGTVASSVIAVSVFHPHSFLDDFYGRIHIGQNIISPGFIGAHFVNPVDVGNLLSTQVRLIEVWNAFFSPQLLSGITPHNDSGIALAPQITGLPATFGILESRIYTATVLTSGSPVIDASYDFAFPSQTPVLYLLGRRVVVFAFKPDWSDGITERLEWLTDVMVSRDGHEQRAALREIPRRFLEFSVMPARNEYGRLEVLLASWQSRIYALPVWQDQGRLTGTSLAGSVILAVDTTNRDYHAGGLAILAIDADHFESVEILSLTVSSLTLARPVLNDWPIGSRISPAHLARLEPTQSINLLRHFLAQSSLRWEIMDNANINAIDSPLSYLGVPVDVRPHNWTEALKVSFERIQERLDWDTGLVTIDDPAGRPFPVRKRKHLFRDKADTAAFRAWLHARQGRLVPFWSPSRDPLDLLAPIVHTDLAISIRPHDEEQYLNGLPGHTAIALQHANGAWYFRGVTGLSTGSAATTVTIDSAWGFDAQIGDILRVCWLELVRLDADAAELFWHDEALAEASISTRGVIQ